MIMKPALAVLATLLLAAPAIAQRSLLIVQGQLMPVPNTTPLPVLLPYSGAGVFAQFEVDQGAGSFLTSPAPMGLGSAGLWGGMITSAAVFLTPPGNTLSLIANSNDPGALFVIDNSGSPTNTNIRLDQVTYAAGARVVSGALVQSFDIFGMLPPDYFLASLAFGRSQSVMLPTLPGLITDTSKPDFPALLQGTTGNLTMSLQFRAGTATTPEALFALPRQTLTVTGVNVQVVPLPAVPEPASWALLIAGFGLTGAVLRRRRAAIPA